MDMNFVLPDDVRYIINLLNQNGFSAYAVGGCIRDMIMMRDPHDYDICTSAKVQEMEKLFQENNIKIYETGIKHGTISISINDVLYEITTYRIDGVYDDNRHPSEVKFVDDVNKDLERRDFTINAMAYNGDAFVDLFEGSEDIKNHLIRCVGDPDKRFNEDALRILRAIRFASRYKFEIEENTKKSLMKNMFLLKNISKERISSEFIQILMEGNAEIWDEYRDVFAVFIPEIRDMFDFNQKTPWHKYDVWHHTLKVVENVHNDPVMRLSAFFHDIGKPEMCREHNGQRHFHGHEVASERIANTVLKRLRFDNETIKRVCRLVRHHDFEMKNDAMSAKLVLAMMGEDAFLLPDLERADRLGQRSAQDIISDQEFKDDEKMKAIRIQFFNTFKFEKKMRQVIENKECYLLKDLAINGRDLIEIGYKPGKELKYVLNALLLTVMKDNELNTKNKLIEIAHTLRGVVYGTD